MKRKNFVKKADLILIGSLIAISLAVLLIRGVHSGKATAYIYNGGEIIREIQLSEHMQAETIDIDGKCTVVAEKNAVYFSDSTCQDKICVHSGALSKNGDFAACLPNQVMIVVKDAKGEKQPDVITY